MLSLDPTILSSAINIVNLLRPAPVVVWVSSKGWESLNDCTVASYFVLYCNMLLPSLSAEPGAPMGRYLSEILGLY